MWSNFPFRTAEFCVENAAIQLRIDGGPVVAVGIEEVAREKCILKGEVPGFADRCEIWGKKEDGS